MTQPPYRRIADEIRARIADRALRPGDPVPSARAITREWGVALATATKVLATLNAEGVTRSLPGRGTVVAGPAVPAQPTGVAARAARRNEGDPDLTRERIVAAAIRVADAEGLAQLSMRRIATELGAAPMSLYRHVNGKDELLVSMMDSAGASHGWRRNPCHCRREDSSSWARQPLGGRAGRGSSPSTLSIMDTSSSSLPLTWR